MAGRYAGMRSREPVAEEREREGAAAGDVGDHQQRDHQDDAEERREDDEAGVPEQRPRREQVNGPRSGRTRGIRLISSRLPVLGCRR
ncbi:MAG: hypothetical protein J7484_07055 [Microbacterium sp.]|nr:hypothetical protein [Microbacterium sp.]